MVNTKIRLITFFAAKDEDGLYNQQKQDRELTVAQIMKYSLPNSDLLGKTTTLFRYDLNQIPYDYTVGVASRFKGLDLIKCLKNYGWRLVTPSIVDTVHCTGGSDQDHPQEKEMQKGKMAA